MKECSKCEETLPEEMFSKNSTRKDGLNSACRECHKIYTRNHYKANKQYYINKSGQNIEAVKALIQKLKENPCVDCDQSFPHYCMDFDHLYNKKFNVANLVSSGRLTKALEEIKKCELVCAICHRKRTHARIVQRKNVGLRNR